MGDAGLAEGDPDVGHLGDPTAVEECLALVGEESSHLGGRLHPEVVGLEAHPAGRVEVAAGPDAEEDVVGVALPLVDVVEVVRDDERQPGLARHAEELLIEAPLLRQAVVLELEVEAVAAEDLAVLPGEPAGRFPVVDLKGAGDLAVEAGGQPDQPLAVLGEMLAVDPRLVVVAVDMGVGDEAAEVPVTDHVLGQEDEVERLGVGLALPVLHPPPGDIRLDADDRLDALGRRGLVEGDRAVEGAVIGYGDRIHAVGRRGVDDVADPPEPVEQAELGVDVEVRKIVWGDSRHGASMVARHMAGLETSHGMGCLASSW